MSIQMLLGVDHASRHQFLIKKIRALLDKNHQQKVIYIVPDNVKFDAELLLLKAMQQEKTDPVGMIDLQVYSFSRLAWHLNEGIEDEKIELSHTGLSLLMRKILEEKQDQLTVFRNEINHPGFINQLVQLMKELRSGNLTSTGLQNILEDGHSFGTEFSDKLADISLIYQAFNEITAEKYVIAEDLYTQLQKDIKNHDLKDTTVIIDHYNYFSANELQILKQLGQHAQKLWVNLTLPNSPEKLSSLDIQFFNQTTQTYWAIYNLSKNENLYLETDIICHDSNQEKKNNLIGLSNYWMKSHVEDRNYKLTASSQTAIEITQYQTMKSEMFHIATKIKELVAKRNYRYKDFLIVSRDIDTYELMIEQMFERVNLPYFISQSHSMIQHPLFEFMEGLLKIFKYHFRHEDVIRFLKTELLVPIIRKENLEFVTYKSTNDQVQQQELLDEWQNRVEDWRKAVDAAENVALALGYEGNDWLSETPWVYARFDTENLDHQLESEQLIQKKANAVKQKFQQMVLPLYDKLKAAKNSQEVLTYLYQWLIDRGVRDQLLFWRDQLLQANRLEASRQHEQAWDQLMKIFDEWIELLGKEKWDMDLALSLLKTGFEQTTYKSIPPMLDQVLIDTYDHRNLTDYKVVFIVGLNNQVVPMFPNNRTLLTDEDRAVLKEVLPADSFITSSAADRALDEPFHFMEAFSQATDYLFLSYSATNEANTELVISPYLEKIQQAFDLKIKQLGTFPDETTALDQMPHYVGAPIQALEQLLYAKRQVNESPLMIYFYEKLVQKLLLDDEEQQVLLSLQDKNHVKKLPPKLAQQLYLPTDAQGEIQQRDLYLSVSQIESFYIDPFAHFLRYGLRLKDRLTLELSPLERGNFFHDLLDRLLRKVHAEHLIFDEVTDDQLNKLIDEIFQQMMTERTYRVLTRTVPMKFMGQLLKRTMLQFAKTMKVQLQWTKLRPYYSEVLFGRVGHDAGLPALTLPITHNRRIKVRGKIDRIDYYPDKENKIGYFNVIDYKSSAQTLSFEKILKGAQLQLLTYLNVVEKNADQLFTDHYKHQKVGMYYAHIQDPLLDLVKLNNKNFEQQFIKELRFEGVNISDIEKLEDIFGELEQMQKLYKVQVKNNNKEFYKNDLAKKILNETAELDQLLKYSQWLIQQAGQAILAGENRLLPLEGKGVHAPSMKEYQSISRFDKALPYHQTVDLDQLNIGKEELLQQIVEKMQKGADANV